MRKLYTFTILLLLVISGLYLLGLFTDSPIDKVFSLNSIIRKVSRIGPGQDLNTKGVNELNAGLLFIS